MPDDAMVSWSSRSAGNDATVIRKYIARSVKNAHAGLKSCWLIIFTAGTVAALNCLNASIRCHVAFMEPPLSPSATACPASGHVWPASLSFGIFFLTLARFYMGGVRIFDQKYHEIYELVEDRITSLVDKKDDAAREQLDIALRLFRGLLMYNDQGGRKFEGLFLIFQTLIVVMLAYQIDNPKDFLTVYATLMAVNAVWLITTINGTPIITGTITTIFTFRNNDPDFFMRHPRQAMKYWAINNLITCVVIVAILLVCSYFRRWVQTLTGDPNATDSLLFVGLVVCLANCIADFGMTRNFYFPRFYQFYKDFERPE